QDSYHLLPATGLANELDPTPRAAAAPRLLLSEDTHAAVAGESVTEGTVTQPGAEPRPHWVWAGFIAAGIIGGSAVNSFTDNPQGGFHFTQEHWFGENTYVGGGDKASHFVSFNIVALELATGLEQHLGFSRKLATIGGFAVSSLAGLMTEIGDGTNQYGFSYEDLVMDVLGAGAGAIINWTGTRDLVGVRFGLLTGPLPPRQTTGIGRDYSREIYTADFKIGGVERRWLPWLWPARFLLASTT